MWAVTMPCSAKAMERSPLKAAASTRARDSACRPPEACSTGLLLFTARRSSQRRYHGWCCHQLVLVCNQAGTYEDEIDALLKEFNPEHPEKAVKGLVTLLQKIFPSLEDGYWKSQKLRELQDIIARCNGLWLEATANTEFAVQGDSIRLSIVANNRQGENITLNSIKVDVLDEAVNKELQPNQNFSINRPLYVFANKPVSQPYWLEKKMTTGSFVVNDQNLIGRPESLPAYSVTFQL